MMAELNQVEQELPKVLVLGPPYLFIINENSFSEKFHLLKPWKSPQIPFPQFISTHATSVRALLCNNYASINTDVLSSLPALEVIVTTTVGLDNIDLPECRRRGIRVANAADIFSDDVADLAVGLLIDVMRKISSADQFVRTGCWPQIEHYPLGSKLGGKRVGIVGLGNIGLKVAKRLQAFGCIISYNSRKSKPSIPYPFYSDVILLAADSDILIISCALTEETSCIINKEVLSALGKDGLIVNVARGPVIDEKELVRCLMEREMAGAGLDVFENEPNVPKELFGLDNVVLSPHNGVLTHECFRACYELVSGNLEAFFSNKPLLSPVMES